MFRWLILVSALFACAPAQADSWYEVRANFFIVYYKTDPAFAGAVARAADQYYGQVTVDLGYQRFGNWSWENRAKIYIYPSREEYLSSSGAPDWSGGRANYYAREIYSYSGQEDFLDGTLPHEVTHLIFREFVGFSPSIPLWLDEGVAQWEEPAKRQQALEYSKILIERGLAYPTRELMEMRGETLSTTDPERVSVFYYQAISLVDYIIRTYGPGAFTTFCRVLRDSQDVERSLRAAYPITAATMENLDESWRRYVLYVDQLARR